MQQSAARLARCVASHVGFLSKATAAASLAYASSAVLLAEEPEPALSPTEWRPLKVWSREMLTDNTVALRFVFPTAHASAGLDVASCLVTRAFIGSEKPDGSRAAVIRPYTPSGEAIGYLELIVKVYEQGKMSKHIGNLKVGDSLDFKGPIPKLQYTANMTSELGMVAGGSGITPMLQVADRVLSDPEDKTKVTLIFANVTEKDIILKEKIDTMAASHPDQFKVFYVLDKPPPGWSGGAGYITTDMLKQHLPSPSSDCKIFVCGPPGMMNVISGNKVSPKDQGELTGHLSALGYDAGQVFKF